MKSNDSDGSGDKITQLTQFAFSISLDAKDYSIKYRLERFSAGLMAAYSLRKGHLVDLSDILSELAYRMPSKPQSEYFDNLLLQKSEKFETGLVFC